MESEANLIVVTHVKLTNTLAKYKLPVKHIAELMAQKYYEAAIVRSDALIQDLEMDVVASQKKAPSLLRNLLKDCLEANKKIYQTCFDIVLQTVSHRPNSYQNLEIYFENKLIQAKTNASKKNYLSAICLCDALKSWLIAALQIGEDYQFLWEALLIQCNNIYESVYFYWLKSNEMRFINYHFRETNLKGEIWYYINDFKKHLAIQNYQNCANLCNDFIQKLPNLTTQAVQTSTALTSAWHKAIMFQRQKSAFAWIIRDYLNFAAQPYYVDVLEQDLSLLVKVNYFSESTKYKLHCKLLLFKLLFYRNIERYEHEALRDQFCHAFDLFYKADENKNIALSLLG